MTSDIYRLLELDARMKSYTESILKILQLDEMDVL